MMTLPELIGCLLVTLASDLSNNVIVCEVARVQTCSDWEEVRGYWEPESNRLMENWMGRM